MQAFWNSRISFINANFKEIKCHVIITAFVISSQASNTSNIIIWIHFQISHNKHFLSSHLRRCMLICMILQSTSPTQWPVADIGGCNYNSGATTRHFDSTKYSFDIYNYPKINELPIGQTFYVMLREWWTIWLNRNTKSSFWSFNIGNGDTWIWLTILLNGVHFVQLLCLIRVYTKEMKSVGAVK